MTANFSPAGRPLPRRGAVVAFAVVAALLAAGAPLVVYAGSLALFGLAHVLAELRYVDGRFGRRVGRGPLLSIAMLIGLAVSMRGLALAGHVGGVTAIVVELGLVAALAFLVVPALLTRPLGAGVALVLGAALAVGSWLAPVLTIVILAVLHNVTPVGFLYERLGAHAMRGRVGWGVALLFVGVPCLIATGLPAAGIAALGGFASEATFGSVGALSSHLHVFVPRGWFGQESATHVFAAATYLQLLHYGAVLLVLPRLLSVRNDAPRDERAGDAPLLPWPRGRVLAVVIAAVALATSVLFVQDFRGTRAAYSLLAAVHAWVEIPVLLLAMSPVLDAGRTDVAHVVAAPPIA